MRESQKVQFIRESLIVDFLINATPKLQQSESASRIMKSKFKISVFLSAFLFVLCFRQLRKVNHGLNDSRNLSTLRSFNHLFSGSTEPTSTQFQNKSNIRRLITMQNQNQKIFNYELFGPVTNGTVLITIQVHNRITYLSHLIESLRIANNITQALLIFSHDVYDEAINQLVQTIDFCMVMQIFYPYSIQMNPQSFPGDDPRDCPRKVTMLEAEELECLNRDNPDMYGHYREAKFTQMKHHWWWKLNRIFDQLDATKRLDNSYLLLLEEDYIVAEDFIHIMKLLQQESRASCAKCNLISLGTYSESISEHSYDVMDISHWITSKHNMGMIFNKTTWRSIKNCATFFCDYDEYNYDFSLQNVNLKCLKPQFLVAIIRGPRVFHVGECGIHHMKGDCEIDEKIKKLKDTLNLAKTKGLLYPGKLKEGKIFKRKAPMTIVPNGGWGDERDRRLCFNMTLHIGKA